MKTLNKLKSTFKETQTSKTFLLFSNHLDHCAFPFCPLSQAIDISTVADHLTHNPKTKCSNTAPYTIRDKIEIQCFNNA